MKHFYKEIKKNLYKRYTEPEAGDYAVAICIALTIGIIINCLLKGGC